MGSFISLVWMAAQLTLLAQQGRYVHMARRFRHGAGGPDVGELLTLIVALFAFGAAVWLLARLFADKEQPHHHSPRGLFRELCRAHQLDWSSRRLLRRLAAHHQLAQPARLFLEPERFDAACLGPRLQARRDQLIRLRDAIFGRPIESRRGPGRSQGESLTAPRGDAARLSSRRSG